MMMFLMIVVAWFVVLSCLVGMHVVVATFADWIVRHVRINRRSWSVVGRRYTYRVSRVDRRLQRECRYINTINARADRMAQPLTVDDIDIAESWRDPEPFRRA